MKSNSAPLFPYPKGFLRVNGAPAGVLRREAGGVEWIGTVRGAGFPIDVCRDRGDPQHYYGLVLLK